jgi:toxin ParE1/3/4
MPRIALTPRAQQDLEDLFDYMDARQAHGSDLFAEKFDEACRLFLAHPSMGATAEELAPSLRQFRVWNYVVFYRPSADGLEIVRIIHGARDIPSLFE